MKVINKDKEMSLKIDVNIIEAGLKEIHKYLLSNECKNSEEFCKALEACNAATYSIKQLKGSLNIQ